MAFRVDTSALPVVLVHWHAPPDAAQANAFFDEMVRIHDEAHAANAKIICVHDVSYTGVPGADVRAILGNRAKELASHAAALYQIAALRSAAQRGVVTLVTWFAPSVTGRLKTVADAVEGWRFAKTVLAKHGIAIPSEPAWAATRATG